VRLVHAAGMPASYYYCVGPHLCVAVGWPGKKETTSPVRMRVFFFLVARRSLVIVLAMPVDDHYENTEGQGIQGLTDVGEVVEVVGRPRR
jgi:hypothetical protein